MPIELIVKHCTTKRGTCAYNVAAGGLVQVITDALITFHKSKQVPVCIYLPFEYFKQDHSHKFLFIH